MKPEQTGHGNGQAFLIKGIDFIQTKFDPDKIILAVAMFNKRAIKLYRKIEFKDINTFMQKTNGSTFEFLKMEYNC